MKHLFALLLLGVLAFALVGAEDSDSTSEEDQDNKNAHLPAVDNAAPQPADGSTDDPKAPVEKRSVSVGDWMHDKYLALVDVSDSDSGTGEDD